MPTTTFTPEEIQEFKRLLGKVREENFFLPDEETMRAVHGTFSMWAPELVIIRNNNGKGKEILLAIYDGGMEEFHGAWHIPGGYNEWPELDIQATCSRVAKREIGTDVLYVRTLDSYKWRTGEHPYGHPLSLFVMCEPTEEIVETEKLRFFPVRELPLGLLGPHRRFIERFL